MARIVCIAGLILSALAAQAATLEYLSLDDMAVKSTAIIRGRVIAANTGVQAPLIFTRYTVQVLERWKGADAPEVDVVVPGGDVQGRRQVFSGAPQLAAGEEYVLFLWTGPSGLTQVIGFSQGVFQLQKDAQGEVVARRSASTGAMLDPKTGGLVTDQAMRLRLGDLRSRVRSATMGGGVSQ